MTSRASRLRPKNFLRPLLLTLLASLLLLPVRARLGETEAQCIQRYGPVLNRAT